MTPIIDNGNVFVKLECANRVDFDQLFELKKDLSNYSSNFVDIYIGRDRENHTCFVIGQFRKFPNFPPTISEKVKVTVLSSSDLDELKQKQLYALNEKGRPILAQSPSKYAIDYYFNRRKVKQHENLTILSVYNPSEYVVDLDFNFSNAIFTFDEESIKGETFYVTDEWFRDVRITINEEAELAFNSADDMAEMKIFRDYAINDFVLIKYAGCVRRGCVLACVNNICEVLCVDYGIKLRVSMGSLRVAPATLAQIRFLAIPCILNGISPLATKQTRKFVDEVIHQLNERNKVDLIVCGKDEKSIQHIDIIFEDNLSVSKYLESLGLINGVETTTLIRRYDFSDIIKLVISANQISLSDASQIQRPFLEPVDFLNENSIAKKLYI